MEEIKIKKFNISEVYKITLLSAEEAKEIPSHILPHCSDWWWLRSPGYDQFIAVGVSYNGQISKYGNFVFDRYAVRPAFRISNLESETGDKVMVSKTLCTVIDKGLVLADYPICRHKFDSESNNWESSELKEFINSEEFKAMI